MELVLHRLRQFGPYFIVFLRGDHVLLDNALGLRALRDNEPKAQTNHPDLFDA